MRTIQYRKRTSTKDRRKWMSIIERSEDKDCKTYVRKSFAYVVNKEEKPQELVAPEIYITKQVDTKARIESFSFRVKGAFYITHEQHVLKVNFCHNLNINLAWKNKIISPKPVTPP